jgi:polyisoprenoid-binding protein YceI
MASVVGLRMRSRSRAPKCRVLRGASLFIILLSAPGLVRATCAQDTLVHLDPTQAKVEFSVGSMLPTVHGSFKLKSGEVRHDPAIGKASGALVVDAASGDSANNGRNKEMRETVLESQKFSELAFTLNEVHGKNATHGTWELEVAGLFRLRGQEHELTMTVAVESRVGKQIQATRILAFPTSNGGPGVPAIL